MFLLSHPRLALAFGLALVVLCAVSLDAEAKQKPPGAEKKTVTFRSVDGVDLKGTYWTTPNAKKNACVLLLHNFTRQKGGNRNDDGWDAMAEDLAKEGYHVLSFDFRGHGESTSINKEFWDRMKYPYNTQMLLKRAVTKEADLPTKLEYKEFPATGSYTPYLVNDIAAAKSFLDDKTNGAAGNLIVIGAGEGATLGAMWMASEWRRFRDKTENPMVMMRPNLEADPEGKDLVCGIWLTVSGSLEGRQVPIAEWLEEVGGKRNKLPMLLLYGKDDTKGKNNARFALTRMIPGYTMMESKEGLNKDPNQKFTRDYAIEGTKLEGSQLLQKSLNTTSVIKGYVNLVMEDRGSKETKRHEAGKYRYFWFTPGITMPRLAKNPGEELVMPITPAMMNIR